MLDSPTSGSVEKCYRKIAAMGNIEDMGENPSLYRKMSIGDGL